MCVLSWGRRGFLTTYKSLHIVAHSRSVVVTSWTRGSSVGMTVSFCLQGERPSSIKWSCVFCPVPSTFRHCLSKFIPTSDTEFKNIFPARCSVEIKDLRSLGFNKYACHVKSSADHSTEATSEALYTQLQTSLSVVQWVIWKEKLFNFCCCSQLATHSLPQNYY